MKNFYLIVFLFAIAGILQPGNTYATHIIGAEMSYRCLNPNLNLYELTLNFYRDCKQGTAEADTAIYFSIYRQSDNALLQNIKLDAVSTDTLENVSYQLCL